MGKELTNLDSAETTPNRTVASVPPLITVLITTYNYGRFIEKAINSVLSQVYPAHCIDVVVVDDGSTDDTSHRFAQFGDRVRYFWQTNGGQASALNLGFAKARGQIISLLDADDYFLPGKLARVAEAFQQDPALGMFYHPFLEFNADTGEQRISSFPLVSGNAMEDPEKFLWYGGPGTCVSFRRKYLERLFPIPECVRMLADGYLGGLIIFLAPIRAVSECLAAYRYHNMNSQPFFANRFHGGGLIDPGTRAKRLRQFETEIEAMQTWLLQSGLPLDHPAVKWFFQRSDLFLSCERFALRAPGRLEFVRHLAHYNLWYGPYSTRRLRAINWFNAFASLLTGYRNFHLLDEWRLAATRTVKRALTNTSTSQ